MSDLRKDLKERDAIDFATVKVGRLFRSMLWPTLVGMVSIVVLNITDGAFVGHGVGSDALAAVNIVAPLFTISSGIGLMFGIGGSIVASVHLSQQKVKAANINITQALVGAELVALLLSVFILCLLDDVCRWFGSSELLVPLAASYMKWIAALLPLSMLGTVGMFLVRLDGSPRYAMYCNLLAAGLNILLDYLFIFPLDWGLEGAAIATSVSFALGGLMVLVYLLGFTRQLQLYRLRLTWKSLCLSCRNLGYQCKLGFSALLGDGAIAFVMVVGNYVFMEYLGEDGVAAYSVACYCLPVVFMLGNAIVQSSQPIISFGYGVGNSGRVFEAVRLAFGTAILGGVGGMLLLWGGAHYVSELFLGDDCRAYELSIEGLPLFSSGFLFISVNIVAVGCYQSIEQPRKAALYTLLRGVLFVLPTFMLLPRMWGVAGIWLALPVAEMLTLLVIGANYFSSLGLRSKKGFLLVALIGMANTLLHS